MHVHNEKTRLETTEDEVRGNSEHAGRGSFKHRVLVVMLIATAVVLLLLFLWQAVRVLLLIFAGALLAILLRGLSDWLSDHTRFSPRWSLAMVMLGVVGLVGLSGWLLAPQVARQIGELVQTLPQSVQQLRQRVEQYEWVQQIRAQIPSPGDVVANQGEVVAQAADFFSSTFNAIADLVIILFVGIYLAVDPDLYLRGIIRLVPIEKRPRAREVLHAVGYTLRWWLIGRVFAMIVVGALTAVGLWLLDVPLALIFGILAGLLDFVPIVGPLIAAIPPLLLVLTQNPIQALYVAALYVAVQSIENYLLTPIVQQHVVSLPPVLTLAALALLGVLVGGLGILLATPLAAVAIVLVKMLYVEDVLGDPVEVLGASDSST